MCTERAHAASPAAQALRAAANRARCPGRFAAGELSGSLKRVRRSDEPAPSFGRIAAGLVQQPSDNLVGKTGSDALGDQIASRGLVESTESQHGHAGCGYVRGGSPAYSRAASTIATPDWLEAVERQTAAHPRTLNPATARRRRHTARRRPRRVQSGLTGWRRPPGTARPRDPPLARTPLAAARLRGCQLPSQGRPVRADEEGGPKGTPHLKSLLKAMLPQGASHGGGGTL